jgi:glycosyltransferase involved in cell wall biosynthesis
MSLLDVLALPSRTTPRWKEQFGRVLIEAMSCGIPPVGSDSGEIPNVVGDAGLIFPEGNVNALADRLRTLSVNPDVAARLGEMGRERVIRNYTHRRIAGDTLNLYQRVLERADDRRLLAV